MTTAIDPQKLAAEICSYAKEAGFDQCGIVPLDAFTRYADVLRERGEVFPNSKPMYDYLMRLCTFTDYPWAKSAIVCSFTYKKYKTPPELKNHIASYYLFDWHNRPDSEGYKAIAAFEKKLGDNGIKAQRDEVFSIVPSRLAAEKAGLGHIRKNGFFYNADGSFVWLETWLIDAPLETPRQDMAFTPCPDNCRACMDACPTNALNKPFFTDMGTCITRLTYTAKDFEIPELRKVMGSWVYGCDACQNACPHNRIIDHQKTLEPSPPIEAVKHLMQLEALATLDEYQFINTIQPHTRFIAPSNGWALRLNAIRAMGNSGDCRYTSTLKKLIKDPDPRVAEMANWSLDRLEEMNRGDITATISQL